MPSLEQIGPNTAITTDRKPPSDTFTALWNVRLPLFIRNAISNALQALPFVNVTRSAADAAHSAAIMVDTPADKPDAAYTNGLLIKSGGVKQLEHRTADGALIIYKLGDDSQSVELTYDGASLKVHPVGGALALNLDGADSMVKINGVRVLKAQQPAIAQPAGGDTVDAEARAAINSILAVLAESTGHGLTA